jgi:adenylate cyclase class 2
MPDYTETEVKLYVPDLAGLAARLEREGATLSAPRVLERNVRYDRADRGLYTRRAVLRLRQDTRVRLTYKEDPPEPVTAGVGKTRTEIELEVADFDAMQAILDKLGYQPYLVYEKYRTTYTLDEAEITLDEMPFGNFAEIEGTQEAIGRLLPRLGLEGAPQFGVSYTLLFERVRAALGLEFTDLTFDNFQKIAVPFSAFAERPTAYREAN